VTTALVAGASGLVGSHLLAQLLADPAWDRVVVLVRKQLKIASPKLEQRPVDFDELAHVPWFPQSHDVFCCLGTTRKRAGSREAFRHVDHDYVVELAKRAANAGADQFLVVSSLGASKASPSYYARVKAEMEEAVAAQGFGGTHIFRPAFLSGDRKESRPAERVALAGLSAFSFALYGPLYRFRPVEADVVARAMVRVAKEHRHGKIVYESDRIQELGKP